MTDVARQATRGRRRSAWRRLATVLLVLVTLPVLLLLARRQAGMALMNQSLDEELQALRDAGGPTSVAQVAPPVAPERDALPLWLKAADALEAGDPDAYYCKDWGDVRQVAAVAARADKDAALFDYARQAARRPVCRLNTDLDKPPVRPDGSGPEALGAFLEAQSGKAAREPLSRMRRLGQALAASATAAALTGDQAAAAERLRVGYVLARHICQNPTLEQFMTATSLEARLFRTSTCLGPGLAQEAALRLSAELASLDYEAALSRERDVEFCLFLQTYERTRATPWQTAVAATTFDKDRKLTRHLQSAMFIASPGYVAQAVLAARAYKESAKLCALPWRESHGKWSALQAPHPESTDGPEVIPEEIASVCRRLVRTRDEAIARRGLLQAALALNRYKAQHSAFPATLSEVRIEGLRIPEDVFSGKPFVYRKAGDGFTLYSIGPNLKDDGGIPYPDADDVVWRGGPTPL